MGDLVDSQASHENPSPGAATMPARSPRRPVFREVPWRWSDVLLGFSPFLLLRAATLLIGPQSSLFTASRSLLVPLTLLTQAWMLSVPLWIAHTRKPHADHLARPRAAFVEALFALLPLPIVFAAFIVVPPIVTYLFGGIESSTVPWGPQAGSFNQIEWLVFIVLAVTLAPVAEETFYRGLFYNALRQRLHPVLAAPIQAAVFGYVHPFGLANSAAIGVAVLTLALIYEWRKTLLTPILLHAAVNAVGMTFLAWNLAADAATPWLGILGEARQRGCLLTDVLHSSPGETAGLQVGDVITAVDGEPVADIPGIARIIHRHQLGDTVSVEFLRGGRAHQADVRLVRLKR